MGIRKIELRKKAIALRLEGDSYSEILEKVPVARSTLALWLRSVALARQQQQRITEKRKEAQRRGALAKKQQRITKTEHIQINARQEVATLIHNPLWLTGVILYWGEGSKQKSWNTGQRVTLTNMDPNVHRVFLRWLKTYANIQNNDLRYELYIHRGASLTRAKQFWRKNLFLKEMRIRVYFKKPNAKTLRKNIERTYYGVLRIQVTKSTDLNRKIAGWIEGVIKYLR